MLIENIMYFALGLLAAGLAALIIMPAVWRRAVRLTKRRIEAATPITMAEFRADKDQLRAEFALSTRRLEMNVESLRRRLAEQLGDANQKRTDLGALKAEREKYDSVVEDLQTREADLRARLLELEKEATDLAQRLRMRERELEARMAEIQSLRDVLAAGNVDARPETANLAAAEASIASAETSLNALLAETESDASGGAGQAERLLADRLSMDDELAGLRDKVGQVEAAILADWQSERFEAGPLRDRLNDIATGVSRLVYALDHDTPEPALSEESLFDRVQRFADDGETEETLSLPASQTPRGTLSDRLAALREIQGR